MRKVYAFRQQGLRVLYQQLPGPLTAIALSVRAGARFDGRHPGLAHMAEHMLFQGTESVDQLALNRRAAELGGEHNADTGYENISLTFEVFNEDLEEALALLAEQFYRSAVSEDRFRKERRVVIDEIRGRLDDPCERVTRSAWGRFFRGSLAHPVSGTIGSVRMMQSRDVAGFIRRYFTHAQSVVAVVGGVPLATARTAVRRHFSGGRPGTEVLPPRACFATTGALRLRGGGGQGYVTKLIAVPPTVRDIVAVGMALDIVGADPDSRLFQEVRERLGLGYEVSASLDWGPDWGVAFVSATAARGSVDRLRRAVDDTCRRAAEEGFAADEVARARKKLRYRYASLAESRFDRALALAEGTLSGFPLPERIERLVNGMPATDIQAAWRRVLGGRSLTAVLAG
jgi:predicted Zn-dependent peptidase